MSTNPIPYANVPWTEQSNSTQISNISGQGVNPILDSLGAAVRQAQEQVQTAAKQMQATPQYSSASSAQPQMPVPSIRSGILQGASVQNLAGEHPTTGPGMRAKGIGQIAAQAGSLVGAYLKKKEAEKTQQLAMDLQRSLELTKGIDEAKQVLQSDPNNQQAKMALQKNQAQLSALLSDPKKAKQIGKAYDITFGEEAQTKAQEKAATPEYKAMQGAMRAQKLVDSMPQQVGSNPAYELAQKNYLAIQKQADELTKAYTTFGGALARAQATTYSADQRLRATEIQQQGATDRLTAKEQMDFVRQSEEQVQKHKDRMSEISAQTAGRLKVVEAQQKNPQVQMKMAGEVFKEYGTQAQKIQGQIDDLEKQKLSANATKDTKAFADQQIKELQEQKKLYTDAQDRARMMMLGDPDGAAMEDLFDNMDEQ